MIRLNNRTSTITESSDAGGQGGLFGEEEMTRSLLPEKAEISDYVRKQLATEKKLFGAVSSQAAAERLGETGNVIKAGENAATAERANQGILLYDKLSSKAGPIDGILDRAAQQLANGEDANAAKQQAYRGIRDTIAAQVRQLSGVPEGSGAGDRGPSAPGPREAVREVAKPAPVVPPATPAAPPKTARELKAEANPRAKIEKLRAENAALRAKAAESPEQLARDIAKPIPPNVTLDGIYQRADWEAQPGQGDRRPNRLRVNTAGFVALSRVSHAVIRGVSQTPAQAELLAHSLAQYAVDQWQQGHLSIEGANRLTKLADAIDQASGEKPLVIYRSGTDLPLAERAQTLREELTHWKQQMAGDLSMPLATAKALLHHRSYPVARKALRALGYSDDAVEMANEIGAKLAAGKYQELDLNRQQGLDYLEHYASILTLRHGSDGAKNILRFVDARERVRVHQSIARAALLPRSDPGGTAGTPPVGGVDERGNGGLGARVSAPTAGELGSSTEVSNAGRSTEAGARQGTGGDPVRRMAGRGTQSHGEGVRPDVSGISAVELDE